MLYFLIVLALGVVFLGFKSFKVVPQQEAYVVERWGQFHSVLEPGLRFLIPLMDKLAYRHSLKEIPLDVPSQVCITRDNTQLTVDGVLYFQVTDPQLASYGSSNYILAITQLAQPLCVRSSAAWSWTRLLKSVTTSTAPWWRLWTKQPCLGA